MRHSRTSPQEEVGVEEDWTTVERVVAKRPLRNAAARKWAEFKVRGGPWVPHVAM